MTVAEESETIATTHRQLDRQADAVNSIVALLAALFAVAATLFTATLVVRDPDTLWQLRVGLDIWKTFSLPHQDVYSFTFSGQKWIAEQWLGQLLLSASYEIGGWRGVVALTGLSVGAAAFLFCREVERAANPRIAVVVTLVAIFLTGILFTARPHIFILPIAVAWTAAMFRAAEEGRSPSFPLLLLLIAWSNFHGSFSIAILIAGFAFCHFAETHGFGNRTLLMRWVAFLALCLPATIIHPYGIEPFLFAIRMATGNEWIAVINEWFPFNARDNSIHEVGLLAFFAVLFWVRPRLSLSKIGFLLFALHMYLQHQRFVFVFFLLVPLAVIRDLIPQDSRLSQAVWAGQPRDFIEKFIAGRVRVALASLAVAAAIVPVFFLHSPIEPPSSIFADKAIRFAQENLMPARVLNAYVFGGSLMFHGIPTFIDGRTGMLFFGQFASDILASEKPEGASTFIRQLDDYQIGWTLLPVADSRNLCLSTLPQWQRVYSDDVAVIYKRIAEPTAAMCSENLAAKSDIR